MCQDEVGDFFNFSVEEVDLRLVEEDGEKGRLMFFLLEKLALIHGEITVHDLGLEDHRM